MWTPGAFRRAALILAFSLGLAGPAASETRALVVGINGYRWITPLLGAVGDAQDIAAALRRRGVQDLTVFEDSSPVRATRAAVLKAIDELITRTRTGDLVVISFAGHGNSETWGPQHPPDVKTGESYEVFLLRDFAPPNAGNLPPEAKKGYGERILGREMRTAFERLERKGARAVFVADACHGGGLTRQVLAGAEKPSYRSYSYPPLPPDDDPIAPVVAKLPAQFAHLKAVPSLTLLAAVNSTMRSPEVDIPRGSQTKRGALSYAFARMIDGAGDADGNGVLSRAEMFSFVRTTVREYADFRQTPELQPSADEAETRLRPVIDMGRDFGVQPGGKGSPQEAVPKPATLRTVRVFVDGTRQTIGSKGRTGDLAISDTPNRNEADLVWSPERRQVISKRGDLIASEIDAARLVAVAEREVALRELVAFREGQVRPEIRLSEGDRLYCAGDHVQAQATNVPRDFSYYALYNMAGDGTVQFLAPRSDLGDPSVLPVDGRLLATRVVPPFGADTIVLVVGRRPLDALVDRLRILEGERQPLEAVRHIKGLASDGQMTVQAIFTAPNTISATETTTCARK